MQQARAAKIDVDGMKVLRAWYRVARKADWSTFETLREDFPSADRVGNVVIFNVQGNRYRLIATADFRGRRLFVKALLTHKQYDRKEWMKWS